MQISVFLKKTSFYTVKIHTFSFQNTDQTNACIFCEKAGEKFVFAKTSWNVAV